MGVTGGRAALVAAGLAALASTACALRARPPEAVPPAPPSGYVPTYLITSQGIASACPIAAGMLLTSAHVVVDRSSGPEERLLTEVIWGQPALGAGAAGRAAVRRRDAARDLAVLEATEGLPVWFDPSPDPPEPGETVVIAGYNLSRRLEPLVIETRVVRLLPGHLLLASPGQPGFSGSCVLAARGVVGVFQWALVGGPGQPPVGIASSTWGGWRPRP